MYTLNIPVSTIRTKMRQEFERHRYVSKLRTADVLIYNSHAEFQVRTSGRVGCDTCVGHGETDTAFLPQETLNFWKQLTHVLKYFRAEEDPKARLPKTFIAGFLEVRNRPMLPDHGGFLAYCSIRHAVRRANKCSFLAGPQLRADFMYIVKSVAA